MKLQRINPFEITQTHYKIIDRITNKFIFTDDKEKVKRYFKNLRYLVYIRGEETEWIDWLKGERRSDN